MTKINKITQVAKNVSRIDSKYWHYFTRFPKNKPTAITGKYLFFSEDKEELEKIVIEELQNGGFNHAKINTDEYKKGKEYVLCLYYADDLRKFELAGRYRKNPKVKYRYWKSDMDTLKSKYSKEFLANLSPKEREQYTKPIG